MGDPHGIAIVGLGVISRAYLDTIGHHSRVRIVAVADLDASRAAAVAAEFGTQALDVQDAIEHPEVETVLNLTIPAAHADIAARAIAAGKNMYVEKPLTASLDDARRIMRAAREAGTFIGCAPDTVLGTGIQTARNAIDSGLIGAPISASATWMSPGHEAWHPHPDFYYQPGGGPMLDMGPYYVTSLVQLLGPVVSVVGRSSRRRSERTIGSGPRQGATIPVDIDTHVSGILEHSSGALSTITMSFDGVRTQANPIEVHGEVGSLIAPDPNEFSGEVSLFRLGGENWEPLPPSAGFEDGARGAGLLDFLDSPQIARASGDVALHVLEIMIAVLDSAQDGRRRRIESSATRPSLVPLTPRQSWAGSEAASIIPKE